MFAKSILFIIFMLQYVDCGHYFEHNCNDSCLNRTNSIGIYNCYCSDCDQFNDCCRDVQKPVEKVKNYECNIRLTSHEYVYSVSKCASWWSTRGVIRNNCENPEKTTNLEANLLSFLPVFSSQTRKAYKNIYCASCNIKNINLSLVKNFQLITGTEFMIKYGSYDESDPVEKENYTKKVIDEFIDGNSKILLSIENKTALDSLRKCIKSIDKCQANSSENEIELCQSYTSYRYTRLNKVYRNKHCAMCNNESLENLICKPFSLRVSIQRLFDVSKLLEKQLGESTCQNEIQTLDEIVKKHITIIGHLVSIISLILLLIVYLTSKKLRNFPGKLLICLSVCLLLAQLAFLIANYFSLPTITSKDCLSKNDKFELNEIYTPCFVYGFLTHYFYLSFFSWSNIMAFDLYRMFSVLSNTKSKSASVNHEDLELKNIRFIKYSIYAWCMPFSLCLALIIKQFVANNLSYGFKTCFISEPLDILIFFVVPIALILLANVIFLISSIISIRKVDKMTNKFLKKEEESSTNLTNDSKIRKKKVFKSNNSEKKRLILYLKLFILTGMTWILGVINSFNKDSFIWHIYIVFNSFQGLFIFVSFAFSAQSRRYFKSTLLYSRLSSTIFRKSNSKSETGPTSSSMINSQKA